MGGQAKSRRHRRSSWNAVCLWALERCRLYSAGATAGAAYAHLFLGRVLPLLAADSVTCRSGLACTARSASIEFERLFDDYDKRRFRQRISSVHIGTYHQIAHYVLDVGVGQERRCVRRGSAGSRMRARASERGPPR